MTTANPPRIPLLLAALAVVGVLTAFVWQSVGPLPTAVPAAAPDADGFALDDALPVAGQDNGNGNTADGIEALGRVSFAPIDEMSGIVRSRTYDNVWWVHNDSGDSPRIFALDASGRVIFPDWQAGQFHGETARQGTAEWPGHGVAMADHFDWEDIALHDGRLWISDLGNNGNARRDLGIYVVNEPNPRATERMRASQWLPVRYPDQYEFPAREWHFDCESLLIDPVTGTPYVITKHRMPGQIRTPQPGAKLYRLDTRHTDRENVLAFVDRHADILFATGADFSPDGSWLAVLSLNAIWLFERPADGDRWFSRGAAWRLPLPMAKTKQAEAICFDDNDTLRVTNEQRDVFRVRRSAFQRVE